LDVINTFFLAPFDKIHKHLLSLFQVKLPRSQKPQQVGVIVWRVAQTHCCHDFTETAQSCQLFFRTIIWETKKKKNRFILEESS